MANEQQATLGKLEAQKSGKMQQKHGKIPSRSNSKTNKTFTSKDEQIEQLKNEIQQLKRTKYNKKNTLSNTENAEKTQRSKNLQAASKSGGKTEISTEIIKVTTLIEETIQTLSVYNEKLKTWINTDQTHLEIF